MNPTPPDQGFRQITNNEDPQRLVAVEPLPLPSWIVTLGDGTQLVVIATRWQIAGAA